MAKTGIKIRFFYKEKPFPRGNDISFESILNECSMWRGYIRSLDCESDAKTLNELNSFIPVNKRSCTKSELSVEGAAQKYPLQIRTGIRLRSGITTFIVSLLPLRNPGCRISGFRL